jgi:hypothetical protein
MEETNVIQKLTKDLKEASKILSTQEARYLVDTYYMMQEIRKRSDNQILALKASGEPNGVVGWLSDNTTLLENQVKRALDVFTNANPVGCWAREILGIGPVISAGLIAHIDISKCTTVGSLWRFAGLDPSREWMGDEKAQALWKECDGNLDKIEVSLHIPNGKIVSIANMLREKANKVSEKPFTKAELISAIKVRPYNDRLKTLCWKIGESFVKVSGNEKSLYGKLYRDRKAHEEIKNEAGDYKDQAAVGAARVGRTTDAYKSYSQGKLSPGHINSRAKRYAVKIFLSHLFEEMYLNHYGKEYGAGPYAISILGHVHKIDRSMAA